jgi:hypothetical protein
VARKMQEISAMKSASASVRVSMGAPPSASAWVPSPPALASSASVNARQRCSSPAAMSGVLGWRSSFAATSGVLGRSSFAATSDERR